jgi:hypothetical protein
MKLKGRNKTFSNENKLIGDFIPFTIRMLNIKAKSIHNDKGATEMNKLL